MFYNCVCSLHRSALKDLSEETTIGGTMLYIYKYNHNQYYIYIYICV